MAEDRAYFEQVGIWDTAPEPYQIQVRADILSMLPPDVESVLDAGCGNGFITNALPNGLRVVGLDISQEALRYVEREKKLGSITNLPFEDKSFDLIMTNDVIEHLDEEDLRKALNELRRVARKYILVTVPLNEQLESNQARCADCGCVYHVNHHLRSFSERAVEGWIKGEFRAMETRLSGAFSTKPFDPTVPLRHELGIFRTWPGGICPKCNSHAQIKADGDSLSIRALNAMRIRSWARRLAEFGPWNNRSEIITLFSASPKTYRAGSTKEGTLPKQRGNPLGVDFSNPAQQAQPDFTPGMVQPMFLPMGSCEVAPEGIRAAHDGKNEPSLRVLVCFPFDPKEHDQIALQCAGAGEVSVRALDAMLGRGRDLISKDCARGNTHHAKTGVPPDWWPGRTGWVLEIELRGSLTLCSLELDPAANPEKDKWEMIPLKAGHTVCRRRVDGVVRSWGCLSGTDGKCPLPQLERFFSGGNEDERAEASWREFASVLDAAYSHIRRETARLATDLEAVEAARAAAEEALLTLQKQAADSEAAREAAEEAYARACKDQEDLRKKMESLGRMLAATEANRAAAEEALLTLQKQAADSEAARAAAEKAYAKACNDQQALQDKMESLGRMLAATEANRAAAEKAYAKSSAESKALSLALETLRNRLEEAECDLVQAGNRIQSLTGDLETERETRAAVESQLKEREKSLAETTRSLQKTTAQRDTAETAYALLQERYYNQEDRFKRLEAECLAMRGIWGGTREILYVFKKRILGFRESLYQIKKKIVGWQPAEPQEWFPPEWKTLEGPPAASADHPCVLVLSHMFPHPDQPQLGSFILDQVRALRQYTGCDVRVLSGRPFWMNHSKHPLMLWRFNKLYFRFLQTVCWRDLRGVPVMYVPYRVIARPWTHGFSYRQAMLHAIPRVRGSFPFSLVHAHTAYMDGTAGLAIARQYHVPLLITEHTGPFSNLLRGRVMTRQTTRALNGADRTIAVSSSLKRCMAQVMKPERNAKTIVLPNGVDLDLFHPPSEHRPDPRVPRIFFVGGLVGVKNLPLLLRAFALVARDIPGATLSFVGGPEKPADQNALEALAAELELADKTRFLGPKSREEVAQLLREEADLLVLSSATETFGCVLVESLACGKPVVATRCGGPEDIITSDAVGRLCENGSVGDLARALREVIRDLPRFSKDTIRAYAVERFGFESVSRRIAAIYQDLLVQAK